MSKKFRIMDYLIYLVPISVLGVVFAALFMFYQSTHSIETIEVASKQRYLTVHSNGAGSSYVNVVYTKSGRAFSANPLNPISILNRLPDNGICTVSTVGIDFPLLDIRKVIVDVLACEAGNE